MADRPINLVADLMDLRSRLAQVDGTERLEIRSELRIGKPLTSSPIGSVVAYRAFVQLDYDGYEIAEGNRLGEPIRTPVVEETKSTEEDKLLASASGEANLSIATSGAIGGRVAGRVAAAVDHSVKTVKTVKTKEARNFVKALGGDRWEVTPGPNSLHLDGTYVTIAEPLCALEKVKGANRSSVRVSGYVLKRDLDFVPDAKLGFFNRNKSRIVAAFVAKRIGDAAVTTPEKLVISSQEIDDA
jgi:hypothetical protein